VTGTFHAHKNCEQYSGLPGGFCIPTESTLNQIADGTEVVYASSPTRTALSSDVMRVSPKPGNNVAFGSFAVLVDQSERQMRVGRPRRSKDCSGGFSED
jgi:hypothetical protein